MRKFTLFLMSLFLAVGAMAQVNYTPNHIDAKSKTDRLVGSISVGGDTYTMPSGTGDTRNSYTDLTATKTFTVKAGATVALEMTQSAGSWMNAFVYVDMDNNGFTAGIASNNYTPTGDLVSYSFYNQGYSDDNNGRNSAGNSITGNNRSTLALPSWTVPANLAPGEYRIRFKYDWCNINPAGDTGTYFNGTFTSHGGEIIDAKLVVEPFSYEAIDKPTFANGGNTTTVAKIELNGTDITGFTYTKGEANSFKMPQVVAGQTYTLNLTYDVNYGDLAIFQIDKNSNIKKYGYYVCEWPGDPVGLLENNNATIICQQLKLNSFDDLRIPDNDNLKFPYKITIDDSLKPGDITVVRIMVGKGSPAYNQKNIAEGGCLDLVFEVAPSHTLNVTSAGWATLFLDFPAAIPTVEDEEKGVFIATGMTTPGYIDLVKVTGVLPANTGVIVRMDAGEHEFTYSNGTPANVSRNLLRGSATNTYVEGLAYVLSNKNGIGLYKAELNFDATGNKVGKEAGTHFLNNANKAYLPDGTGSSNIASYSFRFGENTTAIENVEIENEVKAIYDLTGRRVEVITAPGIYIINGKKTLVK